MSREELQGFEGKERGGKVTFPAEPRMAEARTAGLASEMRFLVPWGHIAAKAWGSPQGHPILCLHGWLDNANTFDKLIPLLPKDGHYIAIDFSGHGLSSHRPAGFLYHLEDYMSDVRRVVAALKLSRFSLLGHSMGGTVACMFSCIFPEMVDKLILVESLGFNPKTQTWENCLTDTRTVLENLLNIETKQHQSAKVRSSEEALQRLLEANSNLTEESGRILLERGATKVPGGLVYNRDIRATLAWHFIQPHEAPCLKGKYHHRTEDGMFRIGSRFSDLLAIVLEAYRASYKQHFQFVKVPGNHFIHLNEPEFVAGIISTF